MKNARKAVLGGAIMGVATVVVGMGCATVGANAVHMAREAGPVVDVTCTGELARVDGRYTNDVGFIMTQQEMAASTLPLLSAIESDIGIDDGGLLDAFLSRPVGRMGIFPGDSCKVAKAEMPEGPGN